MATAEEYAGWIVANQDKRGTPEFDTVAQAYQFAKGQSGQKQTMQKIPTMKESMAEELATRPVWERALAGVGTAVDDAAMRLKQLAGNNLTPQETANVQSNRDIVSQDTPAMVANLATNIAGTARAGAGLYGAGTNLAARAVPMGLARTAGAALSGAGIAGATQPVLEGESTAGNMTTGAIGGMVGDAAVRGLSRVAQPVMQSQKVKELLARGIVPTPGQAAGGIANRLEQSAESIPGPGNFIRAGRERVGAEFNKAALNMAMPNRAKVAQIGREGLEEVDDALSSAYDRIFAGKNVLPDEDLAKVIVAAKHSPMLPLNDARQSQFDAILNKVLWGRVPLKNVSTGSSTTMPLPQGVVSESAGVKGGSIPDMPATNMKAEVIGDLGKIARKLQKSPIAEESSLGDALMSARNSINDWLIDRVSASSKLAAHQLAALDKQYAAKVPLSSAVKRADARGGVFTPNQLQRAAPEGSQLKALADNAQDVIGNSVPNSGTIDRGMVAALLGLGGAGVNSYFGGPAYLSALALSPLAYSRTGSRYAVGNLIPGQQAAAGALRATAPYASNVGALAALLEQNQQ